MAPPEHPRVAQLLFLSQSGYLDLLGLRLLWYRRVHIARATVLRKPSQAGRDNLSRVDGASCQALPKQPRNTTRDKRVFVTGATDGRTSLGSTGRKPWAATREPCSAPRPRLTLLDYNRQRRRHKKTSKNCDKLAHTACSRIRRRLFLPLISVRAALLFVKGMYPAPDIHEHFTIHNGYGKLRTSSRTTSTTLSTLRTIA